MYKYLVFIFILLFSCKSKENILELSDNQSMSITGQGPGRDAAINPYFGKNSIAVVKNLTKNGFSARVRRTGGEIETFDVKSKEEIEIILMAGDKLFLDSENATKAEVTFKEYKEK
jgi:hypothetical protein